MSFSEVGCEPPSTVSQAARFGRLEELQKLIEEGHPSDAYDNRGWRPIHEAAFGNYTECLKKLLAIEGTDVNWQSFNGMTALYIACQSEHIETVRILLQAQANPNIADHTDHYPLHEAVKANNLPLISLLVESGANVNCQLYCGTTPLHTSAAEGMDKVTQYLLEHGAHLDMKEEYGITPIFTAAQFGQGDCLKLMLEAAKKKNKADLVNYPAEDGATPLFLASQEGHLVCAKLLLQYGADANIMTNTEPKALPVQAALEFGHLKIVSELLPVTNMEYFKDCDCSPWYTILTSTKEHVKRQGVRLLIEHGADVNYKHVKDMEETYTRFPKILRFIPTESMLFVKCISPLALSVIFEPGNHRSTVISTLIKAGASVNAQRPFEFPPLIPALEGGKIKLVKMLIEAGASIDLYHPKLQGNFAILLCMHQWKSLSLLLKLGAEVESLFNEAKFLFHVEHTMNKFKRDSGKKIKKVKQGHGSDHDTSLSTTCIESNSSMKRTSDIEDKLESTSNLNEVSTSSNVNNISNITSSDGNGASVCTTEETGDDSFFEDNGCVVVRNESDIDTDTEESQLKILEANSYIPFETFLSAARQVMSAGPYKVNVGTALYKILYYGPNINLSGHMWSFVDSQREKDEFRKLTDTPRNLAHLCRLVVRKQLGTLGLFHEEDTREQFRLPKNIWDFIFFHEIDD